ncbi:MAG: DUF1266 domain-containing protein [Fibrobacterota bacterium]|nr:MAG: DUF1266 domain-containing protein [Fibrobacterota bacterium]
MTDYQKLAEEMMKQQMAQASEMMALQQQAVAAALRAAGMPDPAESAQAMMAQGMAMRNAMLQNPALQDQLAQQQAAMAAMLGTTATDSDTEEEDEWSSDVAPDLSPSDRFALSLSAILFELNGSSHSWLEGDTPRKPWLRVECEQVLSGSWGVSSIKDLKDTVQWLETEGHGERFESLHNALESVGGDRDAAFEAIAAASGDELDSEACADLRRQLELISTAMDTVPHLLAWDLGRAVALLRWAAGAGLLTPSESWRRIRAIAPRAQEAFGSWHAFADNYLLGLRFWNGDEDMADECLESIRTLLDATNAVSPWNAVAWATPLVANP